MLFAMESPYMIETFLKIKTGRYYGNIDVYRSVLFTIYIKYVNFVD